MRSPFVSPKNINSAYQKFRLPLSPPYLSRQNPELLVVSERKVGLLIQIKKKKKRIKEKRETKMNVKKSTKGEFLPRTGTSVAHNKCTEHCSLYAKVFKIPRFVNPVE